MPKKPWKQLKHILARSGIRAKIEPKNVDAQPSLFCGAEAVCSVRGISSGWRNESALADFHELMRDFSPTKHCG